MLAFGVVAKTTADWTPPRDAVQARGPNMAAMFQIRNTLGKSSVGERTAHFYVLALGDCD